MIDLTIDARRLDKWAKRAAVDTRRLHKRSFGRACAGLRRQLRSVMMHGGGSAGVPAFAPYEAFTRQYRAARGINPAGPIGGVLAEPYCIITFRRGGAQVIGWPDRLAEWSVRFQDAVGGDGIDFADSRDRHRLHRLGIADIPREYVRNPRPVLAPFAEHVRKKLDEWAKTIYYKELAKMMKGATSR